MSAEFNCSSVLASADVANATEALARHQARLTELAQLESRHALIYIIVVLSFYSAGIVIMMVKYMKQEREEQEEENLYKQYLHAARDRIIESTSRGRLANRLALQALNMANAVPQTSRQGSKVTFV